MKIALLMNQKTRQDTFTEATLAKLRSLGEVSLNETMGVKRMSSRRRSGTPTSP